MGDSQITMSIMADKDMKLSDVLEKVGNRKGEYLAPHLYIFKSYMSPVASAKASSAETPKTTYAAHEMLRYKTMNNANVFDMNTEVRNLCSFDLELTEKPFGDMRSSRRYTIKYSGKPLPGPYVEEVKTPKTNPKEKDAKKEYEYLYNKFTASAYDVCFYFFFVCPQKQKSLGI